MAPYPSTLACNASPAVGVRILPLTSLVAVCKRAPSATAVARLFTWEEGNMALKKFLIGAALAGCVLATPATASADWMITPFLGANFGGSASFGEFNDFEDEFERRVD